MNALALRARQIMPGAISSGVASCPGTQKRAMHSIPVHRILESLARGKFHRLRGSDLDRRAGGGIASSPGGTLTR